MTAGETVLLGDRLRGIARSGSPVRIAVRTARAGHYVLRGRRPWSVGYLDYRSLYLDRVFGTPQLLDTFCGDRQLPTGFGVGLDERVVEYPWVLARLRPSNDRILDAGSTLEDPSFLRHPRLAGCAVFSCALTASPPRGVHHVRGDLRAVPLSDGSIDVAVCISTLEHIGMDGTAIYSLPDRYRENRPEDQMAALEELSRVLKHGGRTLITVPFGKPMSLGWLRQFGPQDVSAVVETFSGSLVSSSYFRYTDTGWIRAAMSECEDCEYFDVHDPRARNEDGVAAARAVACLELTKLA